MARTLRCLLVACIVSISCFAQDLAPPVPQITAFERNVELYPRSANVYDSLADCLEAAGKPELARQNVQKAIEIATQAGDPLLPVFRKHLERLEAAKATPGKEEQKK